VIIEIDIHRRGFMFSFSLCSGISFLTPHDIGLHFFINISFGSKLDLVLFQLHRLFDGVAPQARDFALSRYRLQCTSADLALNWD
jgi:hypothetical protein